MASRSWAKRNGGGLSLAKDLILRYFESAH